MPNITYNFKGKVALITGSSSGIGAGIAIMLAKAGANVVITGRNDAKLSDVAKKCNENSLNKSKVLQVLADVNKEDELKKLVDSTIKEFGKLDILVNNAGYAEFKLIRELDYMDGFRNNMQTNVNSVVYLTHLCVEHLAKTKGNIVNISSIAAYAPAIKRSIYAMTKAALDMFTKCMAVELSSEGIRVNSVNPGAVRTDIFESFGYNKSQSDSAFDFYAKNYPVGRAGEADDIANAVLYLASEEASFCTGTIMIADGGHLVAMVNDPK